MCPGASIAALQQRVPGPSKGFQVPACLIVRAVCQVHSVERAGKSTSIGQLYTKHTSKMLLNLLCYIKYVICYTTCYITYVIMLCYIKMNMFQQKKKSPNYSILPKGNISIFYLSYWSCFKYNSCEKQYSNGKMLME